MTLRCIFPFIPHELMAEVVGVLINSGLDYCNPLYLGLPLNQNQKLQTIQNRATALVCDLMPREHVTAARKKTNWLPVQARIRFTTICLTHKAFYGKGKGYIRSLLTRYTSDRRMRSSFALQLQQPRHQLKTRGGRRLSIQAPALWNKLPVILREQPSHSTFRHFLKTHRCPPSILNHVLISTGL